MIVLALMSGFATGLLLGSLYVEGGAKLNKRTWGIL